MSGHTFLDIALVLCLSLALAICARILRQPLIIAFIVSGVIVGPSGLSLISSQDEIELLSELGIAILLFLVGLKLDLSTTRHLSAVALAVGVTQVLLTAALAFGLCRLLDLVVVDALYLSAALTFSSTIIIIKLLSDKREVDSLHGRITVGLLIVQDLFVILGMIGLAAVESASDQSGKQALFEALGVLGRGAAFLAAVGVCIRYLLPWFLNRVAASTELMVLFSLAWPIGLAALAMILGFSREVGAFLAGVSLASTFYREAIANRMVPIRDFLLLFFFMQLGSDLDLAVLGEDLRISIILALFVLLIKPALVLLIMGLLGYTKRTSCLVGMAVGQISEFSLIVVGIGVTLGHVDARIVGIVTAIGIVTITISSYLILYSDRIYPYLAPRLPSFAKADYTSLNQLNSDAGQIIDLAVVGLGRLGGRIAKQIHRENYRILGIDFDPTVVRRWNNLDRPAIYADANDPELYSHLPLSRIKLMLCCAPDIETNLAMFHSLKHLHYQGQIILSAYTAWDYKKLSEAEVDYVLLPYSDAAKEAVSVIRDKVREE